MWQLNGKTGCPNLHYNQPHAQATPNKTYLVVSWSVDKVSFSSLRVGFD